MASRNGCMSVLLCVPIKSLSLILVPFRCLRELCRLFLVEKERVTRQDHLILPGLLRIRSLPHRLPCTLLNRDWLAQDIGLAYYTCTFRGIRRAVNHFHLENHGWFVSLLVFVKLLTGCFCQPLHFGEILGLSVRETGLCLDAYSRDGGTNLVVVDNWRLRCDVVEG